jgi:hypothetical protein
VFRGEAGGLRHFRDADQYGDFIVGKDKGPVGEFREVRMIGSAEEFVRLRRSEDKSEYDRAAREEAPLGVWWDVIDRHPDMKIWVVANKTVPLAVLEVLSKDEDTAVRDAVARKRSASREILERLAADSDSGVRYAVACNAKTTREVLEQLLQSPWDMVVEKAKKRLER